jgi:hypothetical protein
MRIKPFNSLLATLFVAVLAVSAQGGSPPVIFYQPQSQVVLVGTNVTFSVTALAASSLLPQVKSGTLELWLNANAGALANSAGQVNQWQDLSGNSNTAVQATVSYQPTLVYPPALGGAGAVRFSNVVDAVNGEYLTGSGNVNVPNAMTAFAVYNAFTNSVKSVYGQVMWFVGIPAGAASTTACRGLATDQGQLAFTAWSANYPTGFIIPTNTYRICEDRLDTNLDTVQIYDYSAATATNFTVSTASANLQPPQASYYVGGLNSSLNFIGYSRCFNGDVAELIIYQGYLSETDRLAVTSYLQQKYYQTNSSAGPGYQWQFNGTNIANATNSSLTLTNVQTTNDGAYAVIVTASGIPVTSSNAVLNAGFAPGITNQPQSQVATSGGNISFEVGATGTGPVNYQWYFNRAALDGSTNATLMLTNVQLSNAGTYDVTVTSPFGSATSSDAALNVDLPPVILDQPQNETVLPGTNVTLSVVAEGTPPTPSSITSGTLQLWLRADAGVVTNSAGQVSEWDDQSGNTNNATQGSANLRPMLTSASDLGGNAVVRFNGINDGANGDYLFGGGTVNIPNAMTAFAVYNIFSYNDNAGSIIWDVGVEGAYESDIFYGNQGDWEALITSSGNLDFTIVDNVGNFNDYTAPFIVPTETYRLRTDRMDTNEDTVEMFDTTAGGSTNFSLSTPHTTTTQGGYYIGGIDTGFLGFTSYENLDGEIAEVMIYSGYLSEADRLKVAGYLEYKYFQVGSGNLSYQWQLNGTNIANATNASLTLNNIGPGNAGYYSCIVSNAVGTNITSAAALGVLNVPVGFGGSPGGIQISNGYVVLQLTNLTGQGAIVVDASTNLIQWVPIYTNPSGFGQIQFVDPDASNYPQRFYRAVAPGSH